MLVLISRLFYTVLSKQNLDVKRNAHSKIRTDAYKWTGKKNSQKIHELIYSSMLCQEIPQKNRL